METTLSESSRLKASETRYRRLFEAAQDGILILDARTGMIDDVNPYLIKMLGYSREEFVKRKLWEVGAFSDAAASQLAFKELQREEYIRCSDLPLRARDGRLLQVEFVSNVYSAGGKKVIQCNIRDNAERKRAELVQEQRLRDLLQNSADGITLLDGVGRVLWDSPAAAGMLGYSPEEWIGKDVLQLVHAEDRPAIQRILQELAGTPRARAQATFRVRAGHGGWIWLEAIATNKLADSGVKAIVVNYRDITERKRAEEKLAASEAELRTLFTAMTDVVIIFDREGRYVSIAPTGTIAFIHPPKELLGKRVHEIFSKEQADFFVNKISKVLEWGVSEQFEYGLLIQGKESWFAAGAAPLSKDTVIWVAHDITRRKADEGALKQQLQRLAALHSIDEATRGFVDIGIILKVVLDHTLAELGADAADFLLLNPVTQTLDYARAAGFRTEALQYTRLPVGQGYAGRAALQRQVVHIPDLRGRKTDFLRSPMFGQEEFVSYYAVPLVAKGVLKGVLEVYHRTPFEADAAWTDFLESLGGHAAVAIDSVSQFEDVQRSNMQLVIAYDATIEGWSRALDLRDKETEGHTQRVTGLTLDLARSMGLPDSDLVHMRRGALLHDIGKMGVPDTILLKPGPLTDEEWVAMKMHPRFAYDMLLPIQFLHAALDIPYCHHEKWDGSGYPRGLKGEEIPLAARIFSVIDVWDALTSDRPYRPAWTEEKALEYISAESGKHFDPSVVDAFKRDILPSVRR